MSSNSLYAEVVLPLPLRGTFTYSVPHTLEEKAAPGCRVVVPFGRKKYYSGLIRVLHREKPEGIEIREIQTLLDEQPLVNARQLEFWDWMSRYYLCSPGEVFRAALPSGLKLESESRLFPVPGFTGEADLNEEEWLLLQALNNSRTLKLDDAWKLLPGSRGYRVVNRLLEKNAVLVEEQLRETYRPKTEPLILLSREWLEENKLSLLFGKLERAPARKTALLAYLRLSGYDETGRVAPVARKDLLSQQGVSHSALLSLRKAGILQQREVEQSRLDADISPAQPPARLTSAQDEALKSIRSRWATRDVVLLNGITSSGKTEIYTHLIAEELEKGKEVLYLLPEIALTGQIINRLRKVFGNRVGIYHSRFSDAERVETYRAVSRGNRFPVILGVRSSVFLPFMNLGLVIIDEEHENTYKQFDPAPRYQARDAAIYLARIHGARTLLGTATPSLESWQNAATGKYGLVELKERYTQIKLPEILLVDTRAAARRKQMKSHFSSVLLEETSKTLAAGEQVILFQNRRGFSPYLQCRECGEVPRCRHCDVSLTYHQKIARLICHYCGYSEGIPSACPSCGQHALETRGFGTEKVEDEIRIFFPEAKVARLDLDATRSRRAYERILNDFELGKIDILVGTQMISKGLDFDHVKLVGILNADNMLNFPDFRAFERSFQLISQVSGRAGRKDTPGRVVLQTADTEHPVIRDLMENDIAGFYREQLEDRKEFAYPPFTRLIRFTLKHRDREIVRKAARELAAMLKSLFPDRVSGPEAPLVSKVQNLHLQQVLIKLDKGLPGNRIKQQMEYLIDKLNEKTEYRSVQVQPDVDPY